MNTLRWWQCLQLSSSPKQLFCQWICDGFVLPELSAAKRSWYLWKSRCCKHTHTRTHTHTTWPLKSMAADSSQTLIVSENLLICFFSTHFLFFRGEATLLTCVFTSSSYRYEVTLWPVTAESVETCQGKGNVAFRCFIFFCEWAIQQKWLAAAFGGL